MAEDKAYNNLGRIMNSGLDAKIEPEATVPVSTIPAEKEIAPTIDVQSANDYNLPGEAFNQPEFNRKLTPKATADTGLQFKSNGEVIFARKDKVSRPYIIDIINKAGGKLDNNMPFDNESWNKIRDEYQRLHTQGTIIPTLEKEGYLTPQTKIEQAVKEAAESGRSFLDIYRANTDEPKYEDDRAKRIQGTKRLSLLSDIIKTVGEGVTTNKGGQAIQRKSVVPGLNDELQKLNDLYKNEMKAYKQGGLNAVLMDEKKKAEDIKYQAAMKAKAISDAENMRRWNAEHDLRVQSNNRTASHQKQMEKLAAIRANSSGRRANSSGISGSSNKVDGKAEKYMDIIVDGKSTRIPVSYINDVAARELSSVSSPTDTRVSMKPEQLFSQGWNKYYDYVNGEFVPKQQPKAYQPKPGQYRETKGVNAGKWVETVKNRQSREANKASQPNKTTNSSTGGLY